MTGLIRVTPPPTVHVHQCWVNTVASSLSAHAVALTVDLFVIVNRHLLTTSVKTKQFLSSYSASQITC